jgi:hypothetical protein
MLMRTFFSRTLLASVLVLIALGPVNSQRLEDGNLEFDKKRRLHKSLINDLIKGTVQVDVSNKTHAEAIEIAAKDTVYPLVWMTQGGRPDEGKITLMLDIADRNLTQMTKFRANTSAIQPVYCKQLADCGKEVIQKGRPIAVVNAAHILAQIPRRRISGGKIQNENTWIEEVTPRLAEGTGEHLANVYLSTLDDRNCNDGARYYLFQAMADLVGLPPQVPPLLKRETTDKIHAAAIKFVEKKMVFPRATQRSELEGYKVLRLQAVKVLAQARVPVVGEKDRVALVLARIAANDASIVPAPRIEERVEAIIGLARMGASAARFPDFQMDYAVAQMIRGIGEFGVEADRNREAKSALLRRRPWRTDAARMLEALEGLQATVKTPYVQEATRRCLSVLAAVERNSSSQANALSNWLSENAPPGSSLFRSDNTAVVKPVTATKEPDDDTTENP